jgi:hypothetical protein
LREQLIITLILQVEVEVEQDMAAVVLGAVVLGAETAELLLFGVMVHPVQVAG